MVLVIFIIMGILYGTTSYYTEKYKYKEVGVYVGKNCVIGTGYTRKDDALPSEKNVIIRQGSFIGGGCCYR